MPLYEIDMPNMAHALSLHDSWPDVEKRLTGQRFSVFLDFDGTLTAVHERPELAELSEMMRGRLSRLASRVDVTIITGRDCADVAALVGLNGLIYAGCHGFDIVGPDVPAIPAFEGSATLVDVSAFGASVASAVNPIADVIIKIKRWAIAIHYRTVAEGDVERLEDTVMDMVDSSPIFRARRGKKVIEIIPDVDWHKGRAVLWLNEFLERQSGPAVPIYVGDDVTDEDAFFSLGGKGITVLVGEKTSPTVATYRVDNPEEVGWFLDKLFVLATE